MNPSQRKPNLKIFKKRLKEDGFIYQVKMKGKNIQIADIISYPASGLIPDKIYLLTITEETEDES